MAESTSMKLWAALYGMIWIVLLEVLIGMKPDPPDWLLYGHLFLGLGVVALAYSNSSSLRDTRVPGRLKRIAAATFSLSILMTILGFVIWFHVGDAWATPVPGYSVYTLLVVFHAINAFAILTQAAAVAIAYDMWEDREFEQVTQPGEVPPAPTVGA